MAPAYRCRSLVVWVLVRCKSSGPVGTGLQTQGLGDFNKLTDVAKEDVLTTHAFAIGPSFAPRFLKSAVRPLLGFPENGCKAFERGQK